MTRSPDALPGTCSPYVLQAGEGRRRLVAGQVVTTLAGTEETAGGFGAVVCTAPLDPRPIPMHWHAKEHDTWYCVEGRLQIWCKDESRLIEPGGFAYVKPGDAHSYQSRAAFTAFFGIVAPGGWEKFFVDAGEVWASPDFPPPDRPFDFSRMGPAMGKHGVRPIENAVYCEPPATASDRALPGRADSFFLEAGGGQHFVLLGQSCAPLLTGAESADTFAMRVLTGMAGAAFPLHRHRDAHEFIHVLEGTVLLSLDGTEHRLGPGASANIPAGVTHAAQAATGRARWLSTTTGGTADRMFERAGIPTTGRMPQAGDGAATAGELAAACDGLDFELV